VTSSYLRVGNTILRYGSSTKKEFQEFDSQGSKNAGPTAIDYLTEQVQPVVARCAIL